MTARRTQRERLQRAKMVARHHARAKAATAQAGGGDLPPSSRTAIAADGRDDVGDAENRDASNVHAPAREGPPAKAGAYDAAPPKTRDVYGAPAQQIAASSNTPSQPARGTTRQRARALSDAKRKLAASRAAAARTAASGKGVAQAGALAADAKTNGDAGVVAKEAATPAAAAPPPARTEAARAADAPARRAGERSRSPTPHASDSAPRASSGAAAPWEPSVPQSDGGAGTVPDKAAPKVQPSNAPTKTAGWPGNGRSGAMKAQRERFLRMQAAKEHGGGAPPSAGKAKESSAPEPAEEEALTAAEPSADRRLRLQAAGTAGGDAPDDLHAPEAPLDAPEGLGLKCSASGESVDSSAFLGVVTASESVEEWEDAPSGEEGAQFAAGVSEAGEEETLDGEGVLFSLSEDEGAELGAAAAAVPAPSGGVPEPSPRPAASNTPMPSDAVGAFDDAALWPADDFSSASWGSPSPPAMGDGWSDPFAAAIDMKENEPAPTQGAAREDPWPERTAGLTAVTFLPAEDDKENLAWPADAAVFGAEEPAVAADDVGEEEEAWSTDEPAALAAEDDDEDGVAPEEEPQENDKAAWADEMGGAGSAQYQGFGSVLSDGRLLRGATESMDEGGSCEDEDVDGSGDEVCSSRASEASVGSATEFDPRSLFGEGDDVSPQREDGVALADTTTTASALSWKPDDSSKGISFPSMPPPRAKAWLPSDSPAGTESLESWWQSRHASTQNSEINSAVQEALAKKVPDDGGVAAAVADDEALAAEEPTRPAAADEEDSIFSGLDDAMSHPGVRPTLAAQKYHSMATRAPERASNTAADRAIANSESDEDLFSGMSVASRSQFAGESNLGSQFAGGSKLSSQFPRLPESNAMKSLLDGASTAESPSVIQPPQPPPPKTATNNEGAEAASRLFLPERGYGVVTTRASHSPTDRSVTSDITSSIVFGGDRDAARKLRPLGILETTAEAPEPEEVSPLAADFALPSMEGDVVEGHAHGQEVDGGSRGGSGEPSAASVGDESTASLTQTTMTDTLTHFRESLLARFGCGALNTSSFAFCAAPAAHAPAEGRDQPSSGASQGQCSGPTDGAVARDDWSGIGEGSRRSTDDEGPSSSSSEEFHKATSRFYATKDGGSAAPGDRGTATDHGPPSVDESKRWTSYDEALVAGAEQELDDGHDEGTAPPSAEESEARRKETREAQARAYEGRLRYAYTALSVPQMLDFVVGKGEGLEETSALDPSVVCPDTPVLGREGVDTILAKLSTEGWEVLKLNREKKWQPRFLTITRETRGQGIDARPLGLLWMKKFDARHRSVASIDKHGKGGMPFRAIERVSVRKDNHSLSRKQKRGPFKDSVTLVLHTETKREVLFRCARKDDAFALAAGVQAIIDRVRGEQDKENMLGPTSPSRTPTAAAKPFSPKALSSPVDEDRWEV